MTRRAVESRPARIGGDDGHPHIGLAPCCRYLVIFTVARGGVSAKTL
jgi:hypothetical protein